MASPHVMPVTVSTALVSQGRVLNALILREIKTRFGKTTLGYFWALFEPMIFIGFFATLWSFMRTGPGGMELLPFLITGFGTFLFFRGTFQFPMMAIRINKQLLTYPQVTPFSIVLARGTLEYVTMAVVFLMLLAISGALGYDMTIENPLRLLGAVTLAALLGLGFGFIASTLQVIFPSTAEIAGAFVMRPLFMLSGNFFTAGMMPEAAREWLLLNPVMHCLEMARSAYFREFESPYADPAYLAWWVVGTLFAGLLLQRALRHKLYAL